MKLALATDHAGFELLRQLEAFLVQNGHECKDFGPQSLQPSDDYPDFIFPAARAVASGECEAGIILGGSGQGEAMAANRIKGARCAVYYGSAQAAAAIDAAGNPAADQYEILRLTRQHNDSNMLSLAARFLDVDEAKQAVTVWLGARFSGDERHKRRIAKLDQPGDSGATGSRSAEDPKESAAKNETAKSDPGQTARPDAIIDNDGTLSVRH